MIVERLRGEEIVLSTQPNYALACVRARQGATAVAPPGLAPGSVLLTLPVAHCTTRAPGIDRVTGHDDRGRDSTSSHNRSGLAPDPSIVQIPTTQRTTPHHSSPARPRGYITEPVNRHKDTSRTQVQERVRHARMREMIDLSMRLRSLVLCKGDINHLRQVYKRELEAIYTFPCSNTVPYDYTRTPHPFSEAAADRALCAATSLHFFLTLASARLRVFVSLAGKAGTLLAGGV